VDESVEKLAKKLLNEYKFSECHELIKHDVENGDPAALFIASHISLDPNESGEHFDKRRLKMITQAADAGYAEACRTLGFAYSHGDEVDVCFKKSAIYYERAISGGNRHAKFTYGFNLYYGVLTLEENQERGLRLINEAASEGHSLAISELELIEKNSSN